MEGGDRERIMGCTGTLPAERRGEGGPGGCCMLHKTVVVGGAPQARAPTPCPSPAAACPRRKQPVLSSLHQGLRRGHRHRGQDVPGAVYKRRRRADVLERG